MCLLTGWASAPFFLRQDGLVRVRVDGLNDLAREMLAGGIEVAA